MGAGTIMITSWISSCHYHSCWIPWNIWYD